MTIIKQNALYPLTVSVIDNNGNFVTGLTITYEVRNTTHVLITSGTLVNTGNIYLSLVTLATVDNYYVLYTTPSTYENGKEMLSVQSNDFTGIDSTLASLTTNIAKILGLSQSNYILSNTVYNSQGCLTSATINIYNNASDANLVINSLATFNIIAQYNGNNQLTNYKVVDV